MPLPAARVRWPQRALLLALAAVLLSGALSPRNAAEADTTPPGPTLTGPADGSTLSSFGATLAWANPSGTRQVRLQVIPFGGDGPGVDVYLGSPQASFAIPAPPQWYGLLPDMTYTWRARVSSATVFAPPDDPSWSPWAERRFRTPRVSSAVLTAASPPEGSAVNTLTPAVQWKSSRSDIFYYEVRLSEDPTFNTNPATATAMVYSALLHGPLTGPPNSYTVPPAAPLKDATRYFWQVRPRVQGDGAPVAWTPAFSFVTSAAGSPPWLNRVNNHRAMAQLPPVAENPAWNANCALHAAYMVQNDYAGHAEDPADPLYTAGGDSCGQAGNVFGSSFAATAEETAVDFWITGPFHALGILDPRLAQAGFGSATDTGGWMRYAAALDVIHGLVTAAKPGPAYPVIWPAEGSVVPLHSYKGNESPDPLTSCPGYSAPAGLPLLVQLGAGDVVPAVTASSFAAGGQELEHCVYDGTSYTNPEPATQKLGRAVLQARSAVVLIPRSPLVSGATYAVALTANGQTHRWSFTAE